MDLNFSYLEGLSVEFVQTNLLPHFARLDETKGLMKTSKKWHHFVTYSMPNIMYRELFQTFNHSVCVEPAIPAEKLYHFLKGGYSKDSSGNISNKYQVISIPRSIYGAPYGFNVIKKSPLYKNLFRRCDEDFSKQFGDKQVAESYWAIFDTSIFKETTSQKSDENLKTIEKKSGKGFRFPQSIEVITFLALNYLNHGVRFLGDNPAVTHPLAGMAAKTRCQECIGNSNIVIGNFGADGFSIMKIDKQKKSKQLGVLPVKVIEYTSSDMAHEKSMAEQVRLLCSQEERREFETVEMINYRLQQQTKNSNLNRHISNSINILKEQGQSYLKKTEYNELLLEISTFPEKLNSIDFENMRRKTFQSLLGISQEKMELIEKVALGKSSEKKFDESLSLFVLLTFLNSMEPQYWMRTGILAMELNDYTYAIEAFSKCSDLEPKNIKARLFTTECYINLKKFDKAKAEYKKIKEIKREIGIDSKLKYFFKVMGKTLDQGL